MSITGKGRDEMKYCNCKEPEPITIFEGDMFYCKKCLELIKQNERK